MDKDELIASLQKELKSLRLELDQIKGKNVQVVTERPVINGLQKDPSVLNYKK
jgi:hypothetical protein